MPVPIVIPSLVIWLPEPLGNCSDPLQEPVQGMPQPVPTVICRLLPWESLCPRCSARAEAVKNAVRAARAIKFRMLLLRIIRSLLLVSAFWKSRVSELSNSETYIQAETHAPGQTPATLVHGGIHHTFRHFAQGRFFHGQHAIAVEIRLEARDVRVADRHVRPLQVHTAGDVVVTLVAHAARIGDVVLAVLQVVNLAVHGQLPG